MSEPRVSQPADEGYHWEYFLQEREARNLDTDPMWGQWWTLADRLDVVNDEEARDFYEKRRAQHEGYNYVQYRIVRKAVANGYVEIPGLERHMPQRAHNVREDTRTFQDFVALAEAAIRKMNERATNDTE